MPPNAVKPFAPSRADYKKSVNKDKLSLNEVAEQAEQTDQISQL